jgi:hypothetical protein
MYDKNTIVNMSEKYEGKISEMMDQSPLKVMINTVFFVIRKYSGSRSKMSEERMRGKLEKENEEKEEKKRVKKAK